MSVIVACDAFARGMTSAALKIPFNSTIIYTLIDMGVSYGFFVKLYFNVGRASDSSSGLSRSVVSLPVAGVVARVAGIFAGFAATWAFDCPIRLTDALWMSWASTIAIVAIHLIQVRQ